ncbi:MAG: hypothetical protein WCS65_02320 [Verrucomicrobiae bacterium]
MAQKAFIGPAEPFQTIDRVRGASAEAAAANGWKANWIETQKHFVDWWNHEGLVLGMWGAPPAGEPRLNQPRPEFPAAISESYTDTAWRARKIHDDLARSAFPADTLPIADTNVGPGSLALYLGSEPDFTPETIWFSDVFRNVDEPETLPPLRFDPANRWWKMTEDQLRRCRDLSENHYIVGCPDLVEGLDILATLREPQTLLIDMIERPEWVEEKLHELSAVWFEAYDRIYDIIRLDDGSSAYWAFYLWGPGKTAKVQCDMSAMFSPAMFERFVVPTLTGQCERLDCSLYHLDGTQAACHLDLLLGIEALDAIEWTPQAGIEPGGSPRWHGLYKRILEAGKSVQVMDVRHEEILPLLDAIGGKGVYIVTKFASEREAEELAAMVEAYR